MTAAQGLRNTTGMRPVYLRSTVPVEVGAVPRNGLPVRPYIYRGAGVDVLTPELDDAGEPETPRMSKGLDRYLLAGVERLSIAQAAAVLGVSKRAVVRYRAALRGASCPA